MSTLAQLSRQLDNALRAFAVELARSADKGYEFTCLISKREYETGSKIEYACGSYYGDKARGNDAGATLLESRRRQGWNEAHEPMALIKGPKAEAGSGSRQDDEVPFLWLRLAGPRMRPPSETLRSLRYARVFTRSTLARSHV